VIPGRSAGRANAVGVLQNQFGKFEIPTGTGYGLLVPTRKVEVRGHGKRDRYVIERRTQVMYSIANDGGEVHP